jgi:hypothetical protein
VFLARFAISATLVQARHPANKFRFHAWVLLI